MRNLSWFLLLFCCLVFACGETANSEEEKTSPNQDEEFLPDSIDTSGMVEARCLAIPHQICASGLSFVRLGEYMNALDLDKSGGEETEMEVVQEAGYDRLVRTLNFEDGKVVIEGEFIDTKLANDTTLSESIVNRIRIETPAFRTASELHVGSQMTEIIEAYTKDSLQIISFAQYGLPQFEMLQIQEKGNPYLSYLIEDPANKIGLAAGEDLIASSAIPDQASIAAIVIAR